VPASRRTQSHWSRWRKEKTIERKKGKKGREGNPKARITARKGTSINTAGMGPKTKREGQSWGSPGANPTNTFLTRRRWVHKKGRVLSRGRKTQISRPRIPQLILPGKKPTRKRIKMEKGVKDRGRRKIQKRSRSLCQLTGLEDENGVSPSEKAKKLDRRLETREKKNSTTEEG